MKRDYLKIDVKYEIIYFSTILILLGVLFKIWFKTNFLWELGTILLVTELIIQEYRDKLLYRDVKMAMRDIVGIKDKETYLYPELVNLIRENEYHVVKRDIIDKIYYPREKVIKHYNMISTSEETVVVIPKLDKIHYSFRRGAGEVGKPVIIERISCEELNQIDDKNGINLEKYDPLNQEEILHHPEGENTFYKVCKQLEKNKIYRFVIKTVYPPCMSDLTIIEEGDKHEDFLDYSFIMPTQSCNIEIRFAFDLKDYKFHIKRNNVSRTRLRILNEQNKDALSFGKDSIRISQENFDKGDILRVIYSKK